VTPDEADEVAVDPEELTQGGRLTIITITPTRFRR